MIPHPSGVLVSLFSFSFASDFVLSVQNLVLDLRSVSLRFNLRFVLMVILSFCFAFAPQDVQTVNRSPSSCLPCSAMDEFELLCNHLFRSQISLLRSILVWLLLSFYARSSRNRSIGECTEALSSSPLPTTLGYQPLLMTSVGAPESKSIWWLQVGDEEEALFRIWVFWVVLAFLFSAIFLLVCCFLWSCLFWQMTM